MFDWDYSSKKFLFRVNKIEKLISLENMCKLTIYVNVKDNSHK